MTDPITRIALDMLAAGLPEPFVLRVVALARESEGVEDMLHLWDDHPAERGAVEAEFQAALDDREPSGPSVQVHGAEAAERLLDERLRQKAHIRSLVETHGGVSRVAQAAGLPQPSLSRFLNTPSEPKPATLHRLATAMGLAVGDLSPEALMTAAVYQVEPVRLRPLYRPNPKYGHREARA